MSCDHLTTCGHGKPVIPAVRRGEDLVVDLHCHLNVAAADAYVRQEVSDAPDPLRFVSPASRATNADLFAAIGSRLNGVEERLADMDRLGVDVQAISPSPGQYYYFAPAEVGREAAHGRAVEGAAGPSLPLHLYTLACASACKHRTSL